MASSALERLSRELFLASAPPGASGQIPAWAVERMAGLLIEEDVPEGETIFTAGEPPDFLYFVREGRVRLTRPGGPTWIYEGRWVFGGVDRLLERPHHRTAVALSSARLLKAPAERWLELLEDSFGVAQAVLGTFVRRVAQLEEDHGPAPALSSSELPHAGDLPAAGLNLVEKLALLMDLPMLRGAGVQALADLAAVTDDITCASGETALPRGAARDRVFFVIAGEVVARREPGVVRRFTAGSLVLGALALGAESEPWLVEASTKARLLAFRREDWSDLMEENFDVVRAALGGFVLAQEQILDRLAGATGEVVVR
jgi:CRP-like cAMP-binding protein